MIATVLADSKFVAETATVALTHHRDLALDVVVETHCNLAVDFAVGSATIVVDLSTASAEAVELVETGCCLAAAEVLEVASCDHQANEPFDQQIQY